MTSVTEDVTRIPRDGHPVSRKNISESALKVMSRLRSQDFEAYLVGGAVRDLMLGGRPKDFDVATNATPEQVHAAFRNSRIIGRRFKIVHVRFGREIIEVTTFRGAHDDPDSDAPSDRPEKHSKQDSSGMLLRDNVYGSLEEDAIRRDFTINALYYSSDDFCVFDYVDGLEDLKNRQIRIIGNPEKRYREDPVRMLRAIRFAAKMGFTIESTTEEPIADLGYMLEAIPAARLFDEMLKLFMAGYALPTFRLLCEYNLLEHLFPATATALEETENAGRLIEAAMRSTDARIAEDKPVTPAFILAALLWPPTVQLKSQIEDGGDSSLGALDEAAQTIIGEQMHHIAIPKRFTQPMREIWEFQIRLQKRRGKNVNKLVAHRRFRAAYDFLLLREESGEDLDGLGKFWTELQENMPAMPIDTGDGEDGDLDDLDDNENIGNGNSGNTGNRSGNTSNGGNSGNGGNGNGGNANSNGSEAAPRKKRRRRRRPRKPQ
ncbi:polynucleotide adenylyltransferase PcnB [Candidatus Litorirhabdus singularis]|uniref:polynucleotide adenylyltransferase PcnB n=1 Tax=Candidatus Litorirhabdus singularis TaxID=2518993 RepID=UPI00242A7267|nr:polynucleotide adenylyltransferase PcnB [Candidatus Litorirhabdus singularis]